MNIYTVEGSLAEKDVIISDLQRRLISYEGNNREQLITQIPVSRNGKGDFVVVFLSRVVSSGLHNFHCLNCGWMVCQFSSEKIDAFVYGSEIPPDVNTLDVMCARCKTIYRMV